MCCNLSKFVQVDRNSKIIQIIRMGHIGTQTKKHKLCLMYKIIKKMTPTYLHNLLPQPSQHTYATRNINNLKHIKCRTSRYRSSFLPSTILAWNKLPTNNKESVTINIFKIICSEKTEKPQYKHICTGPEYRHHTRIRLGLSALNQQRFTYNLIETKFCVIIVETKMNLPNTIF